MSEINCEHPPLIKLTAMFDFCHYSTHTNILKSEMSLKNKVICALLIYVVVLYFLPL